MIDAIVVGGGLFGQIIARKLRSEGRVVRVFDRGEEKAGSKPAACLMKPSWFSSLAKEQSTASLQLLDDLYGVQDIQFQLRPTRANATVHWCDPSFILDAPVEVENIVAVRPGQVETERGEIIDARLVVVAAGVWVRELLAQYPQQGQMGAAFLWRNSRTRTPFILPWAPYRQLVAFNRGDGLWAGDGTAIKMENWTLEREIKSAQRCTGALLDDAAVMAPPETLVGIRPYAKGHKPCLLEEVQPGLWVASGGAKNGTIAAGWAAYEIARRTA